MKKIIFVLLSFLTYLASIAQTDTLFLHNEKISCKVLHIQTDSIKYRKVDSRIHHSIAKKEVDKIIYKNGKVFSIKEDIRLKHIEGVSNFNDVVIRFSPIDTSEVIKIEDIEVPFNYEQSGKKKYLENKYSFFRIYAAMNGANMVYIPNQSVLTVAGNTDTTITTIKGSSYSSEIPSIEEFEKIISNKNNFPATHQWYINDGKADVYQLYFNGLLKIENLTESNGFVQINGELKGFPKISSFRLISISDDFFTINFRMGTTLYNVRVELK